ncbi:MULTISPECIES: fasciclin domain-containing protein [unclassified Streptosporangium]|uniref:fasciclin domain-containing protein n=1 Tax=unclassified Streptosporangium TaxID=2632669 RepID=UPI002E2BFC38|nr:MULTISPECIES: fasciclin domain-containing protein [unclassified Streptosporangium]
MKKQFLVSGLSVLMLSALPAAAAAGSVPTLTPSSASGHSAVLTGKPIGPGCSALPSSGKGSLRSAARERVTTVVANTPDLSTLNTAIKEVGLTNKLYRAKDVTIFAPSNAAFNQLPPATLKKLLGDKAQLTKLLTYHVVQGAKSPSQLVGAPLKTMQGGQITVKGSGQNYIVSGRAKVVCGGIPTKNATVYIIDKVLLPHSK